MTEPAPPQRPDDVSSAPPHRYTAHMAAAIETRWQAWWAAHDTFRIANPGDPGFDASRPKFFCLDMFPYPSGAGLHVGHPEGYTATDIISRFKRMKGFNVLHPMGWDAFGLPAEQYAIATNVHPAKTTRGAIDTFRRQLQRFGFSYDWSREIATIDAEYYRWTQWIWLRLYDAWYDEHADRARPISDLVAMLARDEARIGPSDTVAFRSDVTFSGARAWSKAAADEKRAFIDEQRLAYISEQVVNWCPKLGTVLANEEVIDGKSERGGFPVVRRPLRQWMFRITAFADRLERDLDGLDWPSSTKTMQREWIGRSEGAFIDFEAGRRRIRVFSTRPDTTYGATYLVLAPEHPLVDELVADGYGPTAPPAWRAAGFPGAEAFASGAAAPRDAVAAYRAWVAGRTDIDRQAEAKTKSGVFIGAYAINPLSGARIPIFIADYVLMGYGTGAIMAVPAHDDRDYEFAKQFALPIKDVVCSRTALAMRYFFQHATESETRSETWFWHLADFLGIVTSTDASPAQFPAALERARTNRAEDSDAPRCEVDLAHLHRDIPGSVGTHRGTVRIAWMEAIESIGFRSFAEAKQWFDDGEFQARTGAAFTGAGWAINSPRFEGFETTEARRRAGEVLRELRHGHPTTTYKLRDWLFSRQRYWGEPFPVVFDETGHHYPVAERALPVTLPDLEDFRPPESEDPQPLLGKATDWVRTTAGAAGVDPSVLPPDTPVRRETNTMPNWAGSCWYYLRFMDPRNAEHLVGPAAERYWMGDNGVDLYIGGSEHAVLHLLYARFWHKALFDLGHVSTNEPFRRLFHQGLITSYAYQRADKSLVPTDEVDEVAEGSFVERATGLPVAQIVAKMSKSLKNVVNPDEVIAQFGADTFRLYEMYMGPLDASKPWNTRDIVGLFRFLQRVWRLLVDEESGALTLRAEPSGAVERQLHRTIAKVAEDVERLQFNTAIAAMFELVNLAHKEGGLTREQADRFVRVVSPFAPHIAEELGSRLGMATPVSTSRWPEHDPAMLVDDEVEVPVQIGGKIRARILVAPNADAPTLERVALADPKVVEFLAGKQVRKVIAVPGKMVNIVAG